MAYALGYVYAGPSGLLKCDLNKNNHIVLSDREAICGVPCIAHSRWAIFIKCIAFLKIAHRKGDPRGQRPLGPLTFLLFLLFSYFFLSYEITFMETA